MNKTLYFAAIWPFVQIWINYKVSYASEVFYFRFKSKVYRGEMLPMFLKDWQSFFDLELKTAKRKIFLWTNGASEENVTFNRKLGNKTSEFRYFIISICICNTVLQSCDILQRKLRLQWFIGTFSTDSRKRIQSWNIKRKR